MSDGSTMTLPPPSFVAMALERLALGGRTSSGQPGAASFLDVGCGTGYVTALAACLVGDKGERGRGRPGIQACCPVLLHGSNQPAGQATVLPG